MEVGRPDRRTPPAPPTITPRCDAIAVDARHAASTRSASRDERYERQLREQEIRASWPTEAELRALRAQINPHFLFNALTTIGYLIQTAPPRALRHADAAHLAAPRRAASEGEFTTLGRELGSSSKPTSKLSTRASSERLSYSRRRAGRPSATFASRRLLLQPLVENAVKHGIAPLRQGGEVRVTACVELGRRTGRSWSLTVARYRGRASTAAELERGRGHGVGLRECRAPSRGHYGGGGIAFDHDGPAARERPSRSGCPSIVREGDVASPSVAGVASHERSAARRGRRRRAAGALVSGGAAPLVRRRRDRRPKQRRATRRSR